MSLKRLGLAISAVFLSAALVQIGPAAAYKRGTPVPAGPSQKANTTGPINTPAIAALTGPLLGYVVVYEAPDGRHGGIFGQRYNAANLPVGTEFRVNLSELRNQARPGVAGLANGRFVVVWEDGPASQRNIYARIYKANGEPLGVPGYPILVNTDRTGDQALPVVARLASGGFIVGWLTNHVPGAPNLLRLQRFTANGLRSGPEIELGPAAGPGALGQIDGIVGLPNGQFVVVWRPPNAASLLAQRFAHNGNRVDDGEVVAATPGALYQQPHIAAIPGGGYVIAWSELGTETGEDIFAQRYNSAGEKLGTAFPVNTTLEGWQTTPAVAGLADDGFVIVWASQGVDGSELGIAGQRYSGNGQPIGEEFVLNDPTVNSQNLPAIAGLPEPTAPFVVAWRDGTGAASAYVRRFRTQGGPYLEPDTATTVTAVPITIAPLANDTDPNPGNGNSGLIAGITAQHGTATVISNGKRVRYSPGSTCALTDTLDYSANWSGSSDSSTIAVTITPEPIIRFGDPSSEIVFSGSPGGPVTPARVRVRVRNAGCAPLTWTGSTRYEGLSGVWFSAALISGGLTLGPGEDAVVEVTPTATAATLPAGTYLGGVGFTNSVNGRGSGERLIRLEVSAP